MQYRIYYNLQINTDPQVCGEVGNSLVWAWYAWTTMPTFGFVVDIGISKHLKMTQMLYFSHCDLYFLCGCLYYW